MNRQKKEELKRTQPQQGDHSQDGQQQQQGQNPTSGQQDGQGGQKKQEAFRPRDTD
jgi:hypothetical protein